MNFRVEIIIYSYVFICLLLLIYNVIYMIRSGAREKRQDKAACLWTEEISKERMRLASGEEISSYHIRHMEKKLRGMENLLAYGNALGRIQEKGESTAAYIQAVRGPLQQLSLIHIS